MLRKHYYTLRKPLLDLKRDLKVVKASRSSSKKRMEGNNYA